jgi:2-polyprenyl-3-methyl-5-hydroxy-6-metoxy-1,4-benzoquinol methylase
MWPEIKKQVPEARLDIFSGMSIYGMPEYEETAKIFEYGKKIAESTDIHFHNPVKQDKLAEVMCQSALMLYPCHFAETFCITAIESIKAQTPIITSNLGALPEVIKSDEGILIDGDPYSAEYQRMFIDKTVFMLKNKAYYDTFCNKDRDFSWHSVVKEWIAFLNPHIASEVKAKDGALLRVAYTKDKLMNVNTPEYWDIKHEKDLKLKENKAHEYYSNLRHEEILKTVETKINKESKILDIGCANGELLKFFETKGYKNLYGTEISSEGINNAKKITSANVVQVPMNNVEIPFKNIDVLTAIHVIEHLEEPLVYIETWKKCLSKDGKMILIIPLNDNDYVEHLKIYTMEEINKLIRDLNPKSYSVSVRQQGWKYDDGRIAEEALIFLDFSKSLSNKINIMRPTNAGIIELVELIKPNSVMAEIGSYMGESTEIFLNCKNVKQLFAVDPWSDNYDPILKFEYPMEEVKKMFFERVGKYEKLDVKQMTSEEACKMFQDKSLDIVYIDADHRYEAVKKDIKMWLPKIKIGGIICGHDLTTKDVSKAVVEILGDPDVFFRDSSWLFRVTEELLNKVGV